MSYLKNYISPILLLLSICVFWISIYTHFVTNILIYLTAPRIYKVTNEIAGAQSANIDASNILQYLQQSIILGTMLAGVLFLVASWPLAQRLSKHRKLISALICIVTTPVYLFLLFICSEIVHHIIE